MDVDVQRQACLQPGSQTKSHSDQHAYSDQVLHRNPPHKANPTLAVGKKEHVWLASWVSGEVNPLVRVDQPPGGVLHTARALDSQRLSAGKFQNQTTKKYRISAIPKAKANP